MGKLSTEKKIVSFSVLCCQLLSTSPRFFATPARDTMMLAYYWLLSAVAALPCEQITENDALFIVDTQNDFMEAFPVPEFSAVCKKTCLTLSLPRSSGMLRFGPTQITS
jgi:hypothetical protein